MELPVAPSRELLGKRLNIVLPVGESVNHCYVGRRKFLTKKAREWFNQAEQIIEEEIKKQGWIKTEKTKIITEAKVYWKTKKTRDTNNLDKNLCDALEGLILDNDCYLLIRWIDWDIDKENPRIELKVRAFNPKKDLWKFKKSS